MAPKKSKSASAQSKRLTTINISRRRWLRGTGDGMLRRDSDGKQCCLGFVCRVAGIQAVRLLGEGMPVDVCRREDDGFNAVPKLLTGLVDTAHGFSSTVAKELAAINDDTNLTHQEREAALKPLAAKVGLRFVFKP